MAPPSNDALIAYFEGKLASLATCMALIDSSIASLSTSFDTRISSLEMKIGGVENSLVGFHHEWRTLTHGDGGGGGGGDDDDDDDKSI
ncbi:hypothetical protein V6N13_140041 [Hibiscus sabdariffa]|uniref:Uncharacterized protein n=2 Tax=Hibiscus sabdariffa TaxID=183260 RepID=A0ABR2BD37_9ROSI